MPRPADWKPMDFGDLDRRLTEARDLLAQAARLIAAQDMEKVSGLADLHMDEERRRDEHANGRRFR